MSSDPLPSERPALRPAAPFEVLWNESAPAVYAWTAAHLRGALRERLDPEDMLQEVALRAFESLDRFDPAQGSFRAWLFGIARHVLYRALKRVGSGAKNADPEHLDWNRLPDTATSITRRVAHDEGLARLIVEIDLLGDEDRRLLLQRGLEGRTHEEVAEALGISTEAAAKRWTRLRQKLSTGTAEALLEN